MWGDILICMKKAQFRKLVETLEKCDIEDELKKDLLHTLDDLQNHKQYGLVWNKEKVMEDVVLECEKRMPILESVKEKRITKDGNSEHNIFIEGDNYHALQVLQQSHQGKIDVIYIDPPYNTGKAKEWKYNDQYVDTEDGYRHSKWLSFMEKRLKLAKNLLSHDGVIFISIDDSEQANLKLLCDEIFDENNFIQNFMWLHGRGKKDRWSRTLQQYILCYARDKEKVSPWSLANSVDYNFQNPDDDPRGDWFSGSVSFSEERSNKNHKNFYSIQSPSGIVWKRQWQKTKQEMDELLANNKIFFGHPPEYASVPRIKIFPDDVSEQIPYNIIKDVGSTRDAQSELDKMFGEKVFEYPKPVNLIKHILKFSSLGEGDIILDFFAGSGTTGHAVLDLNKEGRWEPTVYPLH